MKSSYPQADGPKKSYDILLIQKFEIQKIQGRESLSILYLIFQTFFPILRESQVSEERYISRKSTVFL